MSPFFASGGQSIEASPSVSVLPMNIQGWLPLGLSELILQSKDLSIQKYQFSSKGVRWRREENNIPLKGKALRTTLISSILF